MLVSKAASVTQVSSTVRRVACHLSSVGAPTHTLKSTFWIPDDCGQLCICKSGETKCSSSRCPKGMSCKQLPDKRMCQADNPQNCSIVTGMHFTTFDGHSYDFRDNCAYVLVQAKTNIKGSEPFDITISDASCHKRFYHSLTITLSIYNLRVVVGIGDADKVQVSTRSPVPLTLATQEITIFILNCSILRSMDCISLYHTHTIQDISLPTKHLHL